MKCAQRSDVHDFVVVQGEILQICELLNEGNILQRRSVNQYVLDFRLFCLSGGLKDELRKILIDLRILEIHQLI